MREVSLDGLRLIGKGSCGTVYALGADRVIKVYDAHPETPERAGREARISQEAYARGVPTVRCDETVRCGDVYAAIYEKAEGVSGEDILKQEPERAEELAARFAALGRQLHRTPAPGEIFGDARQKLGPASAGAMLGAWVTPEEARKWEALVAAVPDRGTMVHTDFHLGNVMIRGEKMVLIDVGAVGHGHPVLDFLSLYLGAEEPQFTKIELGQDVNRRVFEAYFRAYFGEGLTAEGEALARELIRFTAALPYTPLLCASFRPGECGEAVESWIRAKLSLVLGETPETLRAKFEAADRLCFRETGA